MDFGVVYANEKKVNDTTHILNPYNLDCELSREMHF